VPVGPGLLAVTWLVEVIVTETHVVLGLRGIADQRMGELQVSASLTGLAFFAGQSDSPGSSDGDERQQSCHEN
jgi:hypothetical protein